jgi:hypothetical protein
MPRQDICPDKFVQPELMLARHIRDARMRIGETERVDLRRERANPVAVSVVQQPLPAVPVARPDAVRLLFWCAFPLALGLFAGWNRIGVVAPFLTLGLSFLYWLVMATLMWLGVGVGTWIVERLTRERIPSPVVVALLGAPLGVLLTRPVNAAMQRLFAPFGGPGVETAALYPPLPVTVPDWITLFTGNLPVMLFWVAGVALSATFLGYAPFRARADPEARDPAAGLGPFAAKLVRAGFADAEAIEADDHYVRVRGPGRDELFLHRFADAVEELESSGWSRVHRSHCVRNDAVRDVEKSGRSVGLALASGARVPVSERHQALALRLAGKLR